jgi:hypothetical protein
MSGPRHWNHCSQPLTSGESSSINFANWIVSMMLTACMRATPLVWVDLIRYQTLYCILCQYRSHAPSHKPQPGQLLGTKGTAGEWRCIAYFANIEATNHQAGAWAPRGRWDGGTVGRWASGDVHVGVMRQVPRGMLDNKRPRRVQCKPQPEATHEAMTGFGVSRGWRGWRVSSDVHAGVMRRVLRGMLDNKHIQHKPQPEATCSAAAGFWVGQGTPDNKRPRPRSS